ncbi:hypothetical protein ACPF8X_30095 [Streptomyces sp. G35A]
MCFRVCLANFWVFFFFFFFFPREEPTRKPLGPGRTRPTRTSERTRRPT